MSYGSPEWQGWVLDEEKSLPLLEHAYKVGINTWDTADVYSNGVSEAIIGKALKKYNIPRSKIVLLSKCFFGVDYGSQIPLSKAAVNDGEMVNRAGLSRKHIFDAVDASVERLGTYIDVLQIHRLDRETPREEIMKALNDVVESGKVRYVGASSVCTRYPQNRINKRQITDMHRTDGRVGIPNPPKHRRQKRLAQIHLHAKLPQPHLQRGRTRNDPLLPRHWRRYDPLVPHCPWPARSPLGRPVLQTREIRQFPNEHDAHTRDGSRQGDCGPRGEGGQGSRGGNGDGGDGVGAEAKDGESDYWSEQYREDRPGGRGDQV